MKASMRFGAIAAVLALALLSCVSRPLISTFFIDTGVEQYFVHPSKMSSSNCTVSLDFTFRSSNDYVVCNFTVSTKPGVTKDYSDFSFVLGDGKTIALTDIETISTNITANEVRISSRLSVEDFKLLLAASKARMEFTMGGKRYSAVGTKWYYSQMEAMRKEIM
jgi:hypothetical protein